MKNLLMIVLLVLLVALPISAGTIWVGIEDQKLPGGDKDYNDMVFRLTGNNLSVVGSGSWQNMVIPNQDGTPYWDNGSTDGAGGYNIGYFMTGTGVFGSNPNSPDISVSQLQYWGIGASADNSFMLFSTGSDSYSMLLEMAAWAGQNSLYWFNQSTPSTLNLLFAGSATAGAVASFVPNGNFGLLFNGPGGAYRTTSNGGQFAMFSQVPEPSTYATMGGALLGLAFVIAKQRRQRP